MIRLRAQEREFCPVWMIWLLMIVLLLSVLIPDQDESALKAASIYMA